MSAYSDWEREYDREAYYREEMRELNKELVRDERKFPNADRLIEEVSGLVETFKALGFRVIEYEECVKGDPCGHCERCCE